MSSLLKKGKGLTEKNKTLAEIMKQLSHVLDQVHTYNIHTTRTDWPFFY